MNQYEWKRQARRLMDSQEKFVKTVYMLLDIFQKFDDVQRAHRIEIDARDKASQAAREASQAQHDLIDKLLESNAALQKAYTGNPCYGP